MAHLVRKQVRRVVHKSNEYYGSRRHEACTTFFLRLFSMEEWEKLLRVRNFSTGNIATPQLISDRSVQAKRS